MRWNPSDRWVRSRNLVHEPLIDEDTFADAQERLSRRGSRLGGPRGPRRSRHPYVFKRAVFDAICGRKMQGQHSHGVAYYRCRFPQEYALANRVEHPRNVILREDLLVPHLDGWLAGLFTPANRRHTIDQLAAAQEAPEDLDPGAAAILRDCDAKLARYRAALDAGADPIVVTGWISQVQAERAAAEALLTGAQPSKARPRMSPDEIAALADQLGDILTVLAHADPADKAEVYRQLGLRLTWHHETQTAHAVIDPLRRWERLVSEAQHEPFSNRGRCSRQI